MMTYLVFIIYYYCHPSDAGLGALMTCRNTAAHHFNNRDASKQNVRCLLETACYTHRLYKTSPITRRFLKSCCEAQSVVVWFGWQSRLYCLLASLKWAKPWSVGGAEVQ